jgi:hypothetical protein
MHNYITRKNIYLTVIYHGIQNYCLKVVPSMYQRLLSEHAVPGSGTICTVQSRPTNTDKCRIWGSHAGSYEGQRLLEYNAA